MICLDILVLYHHCSFLLAVKNILINFFQNTESVMLFIICFSTLDFIALVQYMFCFNVTLSEKRILSRTLKVSSAQRYVGTFKGSRWIPSWRTLKGSCKEPLMVLWLSVYKAKTVAIPSGIEPAPSVLQSVTLTTRLCWDVCKGSPKA